jgi:TrkA domain protein
MESARTEEVVGMQVQGATLPGVGRRFELTTRDGRRLGVIAYHSGRRVLVVYDVPTDPDTARQVAVLTPAESDTLAELLTASLPA